MMGDEIGNSLISFCVYYKRCADEPDSFDGSLLTGQPDPYPSRA